MIPSKGSQVVIIRRGYDTSLSSGPRALILSSPPLRNAPQKPPLSNGPESSIVSRTNQDTYTVLILQMAPSHAAREHFPQNSLGGVLVIHNSSK